MLPHLRTKTTYIFSHFSFLLSESLQMQVRKGQINASTKRLNCCLHGELFLEGQLRIWKHNGPTIRTYRHKIAYLTLPPCAEFDVLELNYPAYSWQLARRPDPISVLLFFLSFFCGNAYFFAAKTNPRLLLSRKKGRRRDGKGRIPAV